jgi:hypothetical protein
MAMMATFLAWLVSVFGKKEDNNLKGRARHGEAYDLDQTVGAMTEQPVVHGWWGEG